MPHRERHDLRLIIAGKFYIDEGELRAAISSAGLDSNVEIRAGFLSDDELHELLTASDIVVFPYTMVEASGALLMTLTYGKAILATRVGVFAEILSDRVNALLIDSNQPDTVASALCELVGDPGLRKTIGDGALALSRSLISWSDIARTTQELYAR
jgi:glycosyltransferase involved in cell wall biosynthesis